MSTRALTPTTQLHVAPAPRRRPPPPGRLLLAPAGAARVDFVLPVFNEADTLAASDAQCGFKAIRRDVARGLVPAVRDDGWFFDTELLVVAQRSHLRIHEIPVDWIEDPCSSVAIVRTAREDVRGVLRLLLRRGARPPRPRLRASRSAAA